MNQEARKPELRLYGTVVAHTLNNIAALAKQVYDENREDYQSNINTDTYTNIDRIDTNISSIEGNIDSIENNINNIESNIDGIEDNIDSIKTDISTINTNISNIESNIGTIESNIETLDHDTQELLLQEATARLEADEELQEAIDLLNANSSTQGSVQYWIKQAIDAVVADAPEAFDTLKEIADWIAQDEHGTAALINRVAANEEDIATINRAISELETTLSQTDQRLSDAISAANSEIDQLQSDVAADVQDLLTFKTTVALNELALNTEIDNAKQSIEDTQDDLDQFKTDIRTEVEGDISTVIADSIAREQEISTEVNRVDGRVTTVSTKVDEIDSTVKGITDENGNILYTEALQSVIDTGISNNTAFNDISARWAVLNENQEVLEWMAAGFKSQVDPSTSFASVYATGNQDTSDAISALNTTVNNLGNVYEAKADLSTDVNAIVKEGLNVNSYSEVALKSDIDGAEARMSSKYNTLDEIVGTLSTSVSSISTKADANESKISAITTTGDGGTLFLNESKVDSAMYNLLASTSSSTYSGVSGIADAKIAELDVTTKIDGAITTLREEVSEDYVAKANLLTEVESIIKEDLSIEAFSEIALTSDVDAAETRMTSQYTTLSGTVDGLSDTIDSLDGTVTGLSTTLAGVSTKADANEAKVNAITTTDSSSTTVLSQSAVNSAMLLLLGQTGSDTKTIIESLAYGEAESYFATIDISTIVHNAVEDEIAQAGVASQSYVDGKVSTAETTIYSYLKDSNDNIISSASILNTANDNEAKLDALATWNGNTPTGYKYTSGLVTEANKDSAVASLFAQGTSSTSKTNVMAMITAEVQGEVSSLTLTGDKIYLNANETLANTIRATQGTIGGFTIGSDSLSYGNYGSGYFGIVASETSGPMLSILGSEGAEESHGVRLNESGLTFYSNYRRLHQYVETNKINLDGSGSLANGKLSWDTDGNIGISSGGIVLDTTMTSPWSHQDVGGLGALIIGKDESFTLDSAKEYNQSTGKYETTETYTYDSVKQLASAMEGAITDASGWGITLFNPNPLDLGTIEDQEGISPINGVNHLYPNCRLHVLDGQSSSLGPNIYRGSVLNVEGAHLWVDKNFCCAEDATVFGKLTADEFVKFGGTSAQFLKADGSVDSNTYITASALTGYLPLIGGTITGNLYIAEKLSISAQSGSPEDPESYDFYLENGVINIDDRTVIERLRIKADSIIKNGGTSSQFLKADGSVDNNTYLPLYTNSNYSTTFDATSFCISREVLDEGNDVARIYPGSIYLENHNGATVTLGIRDNGLHIDNAVNITGDCHADNFIQNSDETLKNKIADVELSIEQIANAPAIKFTWKSENDSEVNVGTIAQYWEEVLPEVVYKGINDKLALNYSALATVSTINLAKEVVQLKARVIELESKLNS